MSVTAPPSNASTAPRVLTTTEWTTRAADHLARAERWTTPYRARRSRRETHPVHDFLFQYYMYGPAKLEEWHPPAFVSLEDSPEARDRFRAPYRVAGGVVSRDPALLPKYGGRRISEALAVLEATRRRPANFGCFGVHEWAMVYGGENVRHAGVAPLRLPQREVDDFVESRPVACTHFDAFRFFTEEAKPFNRIPLSWEQRHELEQPGCIHANMDLYRWAYASMPWVGSDLLMACFDLAVDLRVLDMRASPYDLSALGFTPVSVETQEGRDEYRAQQQAFAERASVLRDELIETLRSLPGATAEETP